MDILFDMLPTTPQYTQAMHAEQAEYNVIDAFDVGLHYATYITVYL